MTNSSRIKPILRIFDIDGTIYDTFDKNKAAYEAAGLPFEYTQFHFANNRKKWNVEVPESVFELKSAIQHKYMHLVSKAPAHDLFFTTKDYKVTLTGSQKSAVKDLEDHFDVDLNCVGYNMTKEQKLEIIRAYEKSYNVVYYEDSPSIAYWMGMNGVHCVLVTLNRD